jgi:hypothetical protein
MARASSGVDSMTFLERKIGSLKCLSAELNVVTAKVAPGQERNLGRL